MLKLVVMLISAIVSANFFVDGKFVNSFGLDERTMYGWKLETSSGLFNDRDCYGIFIGPRVFLTQSECVGNINEWNSIKIINSIYSSDVVKTPISISKDKIFTGKDLKTGKPVFDRKVALLIIDEPVIPFNEITANSFVKLAEDINDVDLSKCFMPEVTTPPIIAKKSCQMKDLYLTDNSIKEFTCTQDPNQFTMIERLSGRGWNGKGLFCGLKKNPDITVLTGYVGSVYPLYGHSSFNYLDTVINLSGLNIDVMSF